MGATRTNANKVLCLLAAMLLCFVFCVAAPVNAMDNVPPVAKRSVELREASKTPLGLGVQEESTIALHSGLQVDKLLWAKLAMIVLKDLYCLTHARVIPLPAPSAYHKLRLINTLLTTGP